MTSDQSINTLDDENKSLNLQADLCQSLTHPFRLKILQILQDGEKNVSDIKTLTKKPQPYISQHLRVLRDKGAVTTRREANEVYYSLADSRILEICDLVADLISKKLKSQE
ncbi:MAG: winged helix-turn-helix transcriptional regulator [Candidatus Heimdallarchaeota archaeon]|nr:MAG: winged helix-turn-helix transcriptional regulator [Candidatus Heimdallarchaeota archaeon]